MASIVNETPISIDNGCISGVDENGQKCVILPIDTNYIIQITGRNDDLVNIGISEYNAVVGDLARNINYFDIELKAGEKLKIVIP